MRHIAIDLETVGLNPYGGTIWMLAYFDGTSSKVFHNKNGLTIADIPKKVREELEDNSICKVIHSSAFDVPYLELVLGIQVTNIWDTRLIEQVIVGKNIPKSNTDVEVNKLYSSSLKYVLTRYGLANLNKKVRANFIDRPKGIPFTKEEIEYAASDVKYLLMLQKAQDYLLHRDGLKEVGYLENAVAGPVAKMKSVGIGFDKSIWIHVAKVNNGNFEKRMSKLPAEVGNWNSPMQVKKFFRNRGILIDSFDDLEATLQSTGNEVLRDFIHARSLHKSVTSYGLNWLEEGYVDSDSRIRCNTEQIQNTGRMSMNTPNLQQLPAGGQHRAAFVPSKGKVFVIGDFTGQEIGIMAAGAGEDIWIDALLRGDDVHSLTASMLYGNLWEEGTDKGCKFPKKCSCPQHKELRDSAKVLNFMLAYGGGPMKFAEKTGVTELEARVIVKRYKKVIPKLSKWLEANGRRALETGVAYSADPYRRRMVLSGQEDWQIINQGKNYPIQSAGANMLKLTMVSMPEEYPIVLVIHDEVVLEVPKSEGKKAMKALKAVMEKSADYITGIKGIIKVTPRIATNLLKQ